MKLSWYTISIYMKQLMSVANTFIESKNHMSLENNETFVFYTTISIFSTSFWDIAENDKNVALSAKKPGFSRVKSVCLDHVK